MPEESPVPHKTAAVDAGRMTALDGLRGLAIALVVLSHSWELWPVGVFDRHWMIRPLIRSGNSAVTVFLVVSGYLTYRALSSPNGLEAMRPGVSLLRRVLRVGPSLWVMLGVLMLVALVGPRTPPAGPTTVRRWATS